MVAHVYSTTPKNINSRSFDFNTISKTWTPEFDDLTTYVTEWNLRSNTSVLDKNKDYGLKQAHELINMAEAMNENNVEVAHIWAVQQKKSRNLVWRRRRHRTAHPRRDVSYVGPVASRH